MYRLSSRLNPIAARARVSSVFEVNYAVFVRYAYHHARRWDVAEDAVQEAMIALYRQLTERGDLENAEAWVFCILRRELIRIHRVEARQDRAMQNMMLTTSSQPTFGAEDDEPEQDLDKILSSLTGREAEVLLLRAQALRYHEIASVLEISVNTVKTLLARGLRKSRDAVRRSGESGIDRALESHRDSKTLQ